MKRFASLVLVLALVLASACAPKVNDPADVQAITTLVNDYARAVNAKDVAASVAGITDRARYYEPHMPPFVGKAAIEQFHRALFDQFDAEFSAPVVDVRVTGNLGVAQGTWTQTLTPKAVGVAPITDSGNWAIVAQRQTDGSWKMDWVVPNSERPMPGTTADGAEEQVLVRFEQEWAAALVKGDVAVLDRSLAKEWAANADGEVATRAQLLAAIKSGAYKLESATMRDISVHVFGDVAIATMTADIKGTFMGTAMPPLQRSTDFFVKRDGRWQAVSTQNTTIKP
jgi:ketosteroid isomerase-like protein